MLKVMGVVLEGLVDPAICTLFISRSFQFCHICMLQWSVAFRPQVFGAGYARYQQVRDMPCHTDSTLQLLEDHILR